MGYMYRYNPAVLMMQDFLKKGWLGDVFEVHTVMSKVVAPATRKRLAVYPGGTMFELGCHIVDLVHGVLGTPEKTIGYRQHASELKDKLVEEAKEAAAAGSDDLIKELADLYEVVDALMAACGIDHKIVLAKQEERRQNRGELDQRFRLLWTD